MDKIKLGVIGLSAGNGHPYSWSAICNGYDRKYMDECPFPIIPQYLYKQNFPESFISDAKVTHIWTQDRKISEHVARASKIENIVDDYHEMIGRVDGILLARDDAENHLEMSRCFLEAGMMIYIDKPLAFNTETANKIFSLAKFDDQIFSCSALYYARELEEALMEIPMLGDLNYVEAHTIKRWDTYSAHIIDPVLRIVGDKLKIKEVTRIKNYGVQGCLLQMENGFTVLLLAHENATISTGSIRVFGTKHDLAISFCDTFYSFREALKQFIQSVKQRRSTISKEHILTLVDWIERGI